MSDGPPLSTPADLHFRPALLVVVRHGESLHNTIDGHADPESIRAAVATTPDHLIPLTARGEAQAVATGRGLLTEFGAFDLIMHSPWLRTTQTAQLILQAFPSQTLLRRSLFLTEQHFGQLDPALWLDRLDEHAVAYRRFERQREIVGKFYCRPPDGESWADVCIRTHQFLGTLFRAEHQGKKVLVVTHGVTQQSFRYHLEHPTEEDLVEAYQRDPNRNCGIGAYQCLGPGPIGWRLLCWNKRYYADGSAAESGNASS